MGLLKGNIALITGSTLGIGRPQPLLFTREGEKMAFTPRRENADEEVVDKITGLGRDALLIKADSTGVQGAADVVTLVVDRHARHGRLDVDFDSAGTAAAGPLTELSDT